MAEQLRDYRANTSDELLRLNMTIRATLASFPDPIFVLNSEGTVEFRNPEADELALKLLFAGVTRLPKQVDERVEEVRKTGEDFLPTQFQDAIKFHIDGQDRYFLPRIVLLRNDKGATFGVAVILENVTRMLLLDDVKSNLISTVSHELKTPLTSVRMALYLLVEKTVGPLNEKQHDLVDTAREDADRLLHTLNDLLDLARARAGAGPAGSAAGFGRQAGGARRARGARCRAGLQHHNRGRSRVSPARDPGGPAADRLRFCQSIDQRDQ